MDVGLVIEYWTRIFGFWTCIKDWMVIYGCGFMNVVWLRIFLFRVLDKKRILITLCVTLDLEWVYKL